MQILTLGRRRLHNNIIISDKQFFVGVINDSDNDNDGVLDVADSDDANFGSTQLFNPDSDGDGQDDYLDLDSDGDGID